MKIRRDKNALTFFNPKTGSKLRLAIGKYEKATAPELVDIKITDYCPFACAFCYQGSTLSGLHCSLEDMKFVINTLADAKVFEVAYGGGEPTMHPDFLEIIKYTRQKGIVPNFTTKNLGYIKREWPKLEPIIGAFAYSAETIEDLDSAEKMFAEVPKNKINIHYVMGLQEELEFLAFMQRAYELDFRVTLLGYKTTGRGKDVVPYNYDYWLLAMAVLKLVKRCPTYSIDTPLAAQYFYSLPVKKHAFHTKEGFVSAYIDAVSMKIGASSFDTEELFDFDHNWLSTYSKIKPK